MSKIVYYVASSLDGFISGPNQDISKFAQDSKGVDVYLNDLQDFSTTIMGRKTYEFGYQFGLKPGQLAYPHMEHYVFSSSLQFTDADPKIHVKPLDLTEITKIKEKAETDIYLCGGGDFAGWLLDNDLIDVLKLKLNPIILGEGTKLFGSSKTQKNWSLIESKAYDGGLQIITYARDAVETESKN